MALSGVHHAAFVSNDMKAQIEFFTQVLGMKLVGIFPMHGVPGASHCFIEAGKDCYMSFVQIKDVNVAPVHGVSHAVDAGGPVAGGAMQHISFSCATFEELLDLRDRLRSNGYAVFGPLDHGMSHSIYFGGPEGMLLEIATVDRCKPVRAEDWVDPATARRSRHQRGRSKTLHKPAGVRGQRWYGCATRARKRRLSHSDSATDVRPIRISFG